MRLFSFLKRKKYANSLENESVQAEAFARSLEVRKNEAELRRLRHDLKVAQQRAEIEETKAYLNHLRDDDDEAEAPSGIEEQFLGLLMNNFLKGSQSQQANNSPGNSPPESIDLPDEEIRNLIATIPKSQRKFGKALSDEQLKNIAKSRGNFTEKTLNRAVEIFRNEKI